MPPLAVSNGDVIIIVVLVALPIAAIAFAGAGAVYREIGKGAFAMDHDKPSSSGLSGLGAHAAKVEQQVEIRQMLEAKAFRQRQRGEEPLDVEAEIAKLNSPKAMNVNADPALVAEVRQLVVARNARRARQGKEPLDVEAEVMRQLGDLEDLGN